MANDVCQALTAVAYVMPELSLVRFRWRREREQQMAAHESPRTTALYDRRDDEVAVDEVERILI